MAADVGQLLDIARFLMKINAGGPERLTELKRTPRK